MEDLSTVFLEKQVHVFMHIVRFSLCELYLFFIALLDLLPYALLCQFTAWVRKLPKANKGRALYSL